MSEKKFYDADYMIRKNNEYEELRIFNSPVEVKLRQMIKDATEKCKLQNAKLESQRQKLQAKREARAKNQRAAQANAAAEAEEVSFGM